MDALTSRGEAIEIAASNDLFAAADDELRRELGLMTRPIRGGARVFSAGGVADVIMNRTIGLGVFTPAEPDDLEQIASAFAGDGVDRFLVHLTPGALPSALGRWLADAGYAPFRRAWAKFWRRAGRLEVTSPLAAEPVGPERSDEFAALVTAVYGLPTAMGKLLALLPARAPWRCYLARDGQQAVAAAAMFVDGSEAWFGFAATVKEARGRGAQPLLLARRVSDAANLGVTDLFVETGEAVPGEPQPSYDNILDAGFQRLYARENLIRVPRSERPRGP